MKIVALIPARGGSKGINRKNIKNLLGYPLIYYSIRCSLATELVNRTIVSTDDKEIAEIAESFGAETPFLRPKELAQDDTPDYPVVHHCLNYLAEVENWHPDLLVFLRPTAPMRQAEEITGAINLLLNNSHANSVRTTCPAKYSPFWMKQISERGEIKPFIKSPFNLVRRQDLPSVAICDGYVDVSRVSAILETQSVTPEKTIALHRANENFVDIDTPSDWEYCEFLMRNKGQQ